MSIEEELFDCYQISRDLLLHFGFQADGERLTFQKPLPQESLEIL